MIKARLNTFDVTMVVVSLVIGIGIFRTPAMVASATRTPFLFFTAWIAGGLITLVGALTFAEIGAVLGVSPTRAIQLYTRAILRVRTALSSRIDTDLTTAVGGS